MAGVKVLSYAHECIHHYNARIRTPASPVNVMPIVNFIGFSLVFHWFSLVFHWFFIGFSFTMSINVNQCRSMPIPMTGEAGGNTGSMCANLSPARRRPALVFAWMLVGAMAGVKVLSYAHECIHHARLARRCHAHC